MLAVNFAIAKKWYDTSSFSPKLTDDTALFSRGDLSWIINNELLALSSPVDPMLGLYKDPSHFNTPESVLQTLNSMRVRTILRLNDPLYDRHVFIRGGIEHFDLFFEDGSVPDQTLIDKFVKLIKTVNLPLALHCKAGLGRTGTLICIYLHLIHQTPMKQAVAWCKICRPGSITQLQFNYLVKFEKIDKTGSFNGGGHVLSGAKNLNETVFKKDHIIKDQSTPRSKTIDLGHIKKSGVLTFPAPQKWQNNIHNIAQLCGVKDLKSINQSLIQFSSQNKEQLIYHPAPPVRLSYTHENFANNLVKQFPLSIEPPKFLQTFSGNSHLNKNQTNKVHANISSDNNNIAHNYRSHTANKTDPQLLNLSHLIPSDERFTIFQPSQIIPFLSTNNPSLNIYPQVKLTVQGPLFEQKRTNTKIPDTCQTNSAFLKSIQLKSQTQQIHFNNSLKHPLSQTNHKQEKSPNQFKLPIQVFPTNNNPCFTQHTSALLNQSDNINRLVSLKPLFHEVARGSIFASTPQKWANNASPRQINHSFMRTTPLNDPLVSSPRLSVRPINEAHKIINLSNKIPPNRIFNLGNEYYQETTKRDNFFEC